MHRILLLIAFWPFAAPTLLGAVPPPGAQVLVIFNKNLADSKGVADYYAERRQVPHEQVLGLDLPSSETISRADYERHLAKPVLQKLRQSGLFVYASAAEHAQSRRTNEVPVQAKVRYAVLCYGVPLKILADPKLTEEGMDAIRPELRRNEASVDSELALIPVIAPKLPIYGAVPNHVYGATNAHMLSPTNGVLLVARLDGPSATIARGLVDKAIQAEVEGLWGRAYFDSRGITNGNYKLGDDWIRGCADLTRKLGFETVLDTDPTTFPASYPMSHIALYAGWYDGTVSGPFTRPKVEFMPGAFAYHLHSFSASTIRSPTANWVGPLLAKGVTATMGCVEEPYLEGTPDIYTFLVRFVYMGFTFGEAAYACQNSLSWQTTVVGDPLYRPFWRAAMAQHEELARQKSKLIEWSHLRAVDMNMVAGVPLDKLIAYLENTPDTQTSAVLLEKLGDLYFQQAHFSQSVLSYKRALEQAPSSQQHVRLMLSLARGLDFQGKESEVFQTYQDFVKAFPDYPDLLGIYRKLSPLAEQLGKNQEHDQYQREISRLTADAKP